MRWSCAVRAVLGSAMLGSLLVLATPAFASGCTVVPGSTACLAPMFANDGAHFNARVWNSYVNAPMTPHNALWRKYDRMYRAATTDAQALAILTKYEALTHSFPQQLYGSFPSLAEAHRECRVLLPLSGYRYNSKDCDGWAGAHWRMITGWQFEQNPEDKHSQNLVVYGFANGGNESPTSISDMMPYPPIVAKETPAWFVQDSPLPLIYYFDTLRGITYPGSHSKAWWQNTTAAIPSYRVAQFLAFWGYGSPGVFMAKSLLRVMQKEGFNPRMAGGPNVPPGTPWPKWTTIRWSPAVFAAAGWTHPHWPRWLETIGGLPILGG